MSQNHDRSIPVLKEQEWVPLRRQYYPPPRDVTKYASRALPQLPTLATPEIQSSSSSIYEPREDHERQHTPSHVLYTNKASDSPKSTTLGGGIDGPVMAMVRPPQIRIPNRLPSHDHGHVVSPQPQRLDSKLISMWANGDELVSPLDTPGTASWKTHIVSPLSDSSGTGQASVHCESWYDDTSSDEGEEEEQPDSSNQTQKNQFADDAFSRVSRSQMEKTGLPYSEPATPLRLSLDGGLGSPGPDVGCLQDFNDLSLCRTDQPQRQTRSTDGTDELDGPQDNDESMGELKISFVVPEIATFSSNRPGASQRPVPPPLNLNRQPPPPVREGYVKSPFPPGAGSASAQRAAFKTDEPTVHPQQKGRSGLGGLATLRRSSTLNSPRQPPPGFTEMLSQLDRQGAISPVPRVKNILSKARQGLGISSEESKKEKRREEFKRQIRRQDEI
ncbi:hypothetical protein GGS24DRAFT_205341 [Hypoxylon argillaceum]|nr:hypothetical protein GGS24DRAFT_205341 [Hypoxylon argillaceum]